MKTRLLKELEFLDQYRSSTLRLFLDWILKQAGLPGEEVQKRCHFYVEDGEDEGNEVFLLNASRLPKDQQQQLFTFLQIDKVNKNKWVLNEDKVFKVLLPDFIKDMRNHSAFSADELERYKRLTKESGQQLLLDSIQKQLADLMRSSAIDESFYESLREVEHTFFSYFVCNKGAYLEGAHQLIQQISTLEKMLPPAIQDEFSTLRNSIQQIITSGLANEWTEKEAFEREKNEFLKQYKITPQKCDIFEHILIKVAGLTTIPNSSSHSNFIRDLNINFTFYHTQDMEAEVQRLVEFLRAQGDGSAMLHSKEHYVKVERYEYKNMGYRYRESGEKVLVCKPCLIKEANMPIVCSFSADAKIFREKVWPLMKKYIEELAKNNPEALVPYQKKCAEYFAAKMTVSDKADALFSVGRVKLEEGGIAPVAVP